MSFRCLIVNIITVLIVLPLQSHALSHLYAFRHLYEQTNVSPSPSPASGGSSFQQSCTRASGSCQLKSITACLIYSQTEICLLVQNNGENRQHVKIMIFPAKNTIKEINITGHQIEKINISSGVDLSSAIALITSDGDCVISTAAAPPPENHFQKHSYGTHITPANGAYLLIILVIVGGILTFFKLRTRSRHLEGVPYHELEMGNSTALNMEENETENWDQDWDDQWDDQKSAKSGKSGGDDHVLVKQSNDLTTKLPNSNGRKKEWDD